MKIKVKYADVMVINPDVNNEPIPYLIPNKNFSTFEKAANCVRRKFGLKNVAVTGYKNHVCEYELTDDMVKEYVEGKKND